ncbi:monocarboxylate transporter 3-like [Dendroctonus ponderosae]|uniref:monocarboxylate transporter 3-like n=1 Tax=Dendroctonus ponderosae TaxID=77166 RepID=UPI002034EEA9|nr:monocarboxylate transporter 3-like [Dendroctonus ponderosae]
MKDSTMISKSSKVNGLGSKAPTTRSALAELAEPLVSVPPDGGWGWAVMVAVTFVMFCVDGLGYCFSIFFEEMMRDFHCELTDIALLSALSGGFYYLFGPLTCSIVNRFGFQVVAVFGGALLAGVYLLASFTTSLPLFLTLVGLMGGCGFNLIYTASLVSIGFYFERWRALAMAVTCCGSSLGVVVFPALMVQFFSDWSWRSVFRMVAGVFAVCAVVGLVLKPIKAVRVERTVQFGQVSQRTSMCGSRLVFHSRTLT